ncbi:unnamed protein product [Sphagnum balticum]
MKVRREVPRYNNDGNRAKKDAVQYRCGVCGQWTKSTAVAVDHITPVIDVQVGFVDWNTFVQRLFCDASNLQVICDTCHNAKTQAERIARLNIQYAQELDVLEQAFKTDNHENVTEDVAADLIVKAEMKIKDIKEERAADGKLEQAKQIVKDLNGAYNSTIKYEQAKIAFLLEKIQEIQSGDVNPSSGANS